ncbi:MAG: NBR1-Ig-like domain-containing protein, partial [Anaerolineales bacterium]
MKSKLQVSSMLLLIALVLSFVPAAALPESASAAQTCTDRAQFVADVTVPDGTRYDPGATFTKTWRLRNTGTCTWTTSYTMVFDSGTQMGSTASVTFPNSVAPGATVDLSVNMTAPSSAGHYIGYWKFKNASGAIFGIGVNANKAWWVEINVTGTTQGGVAYDFTANAGSATWSSGAGGLSFPGTDGEAKGFALKLDKPNFESGVVASQPGLLFYPHQITNGFIQARYPDFTVQNGDRFQATVGCQAGATSCYVAYRLDYEVGGTIRTFWTFREKFEGWTYNANLNLSPLAGQTVKFILYISAWGSPVGDRALWGNPVIARAGSTPPPPVTGTPPTATPSKTPGPVTVTVPPSSCDKAQFVADRTVPDGTVMAPGATFTKTWRLKNVGSCAWSTSYQLVFFSGEQMGAATSAAFPQNVAVGQTIDISINMTAPAAAGSYRGYWMFKNASGALFGIGAQANKPWWVDIRVSGPTVTPGGPTLTPSPTGGPTVTPSAGTAYDFASNACAGTWYSGAGQLPCPGTDGDAKGFLLKISNPKLETGATDSRPGIVTFPQNVQNGYIQGFFPPFKVQSGDRFRSIINCQGGATTCYVAFRLDYQTGSDPIKTFWGPFLERYEGQYFSVDVDLTPLAGKDVKFVLTVLSAGVATGDRALWVGPIIYRPGSSSALPDLTITQMKVELQNPSCLMPGDTFGLRASVTNSGQASAGSFAVKTGDAQQTVNGLAIGETKIVFFPGYSNPSNSPVTVIVDSGGAIAESNEQNNSRTETLFVQTPTPPVPCTPTPTPASTVTPTATPIASPTGTPTVTPTNSSTTYQNTKYNFKFTLPPGSNIVSQSDTNGQVSLPLVTAGTNLISKDLRVSVVEGANPCVSPWAENPTSSENVTINNIPFLKQSGQGAAAG